MNLLLCQRSRPCEERSVLMLMIGKLLDSMIPEM